MIYINEDKMEFHIQSKNSSYIFHVMENGQLGNLYYGKKIRPRDNYNEFFKLPDIGIGIIAHLEENPGFSLEYIKQEYPSYGTTDFRKPAIEIEDELGCRITDFKYKGCEVIEGKPSILGLPSSYVEDKTKAQTLIIILYDGVLECELKLYYTCFEDKDAIIRRAVVENKGEQELKVNNLMSLSLDLPDRNYEMVQFSGAWSRERNKVTRPLQVGSQYIDSTRGASSAHQNPFFILKRPETNEEIGESIGFSLVYSGDFLAHLEVDHFDTTRVIMGINPFNFRWNLEPTKKLSTPEVIMSYSNNGLGDLSRNYHEIIKENIMRGYWKKRERPVLVNNWEATYFDFNEEKIVKMAKKAKGLGFDLFVLDDGWFGERNDDSSSLGDWHPNEKKLPNGLKGLSQKVDELGIKFGIWFEPEMISKKSNLYKKYPDWILGAKNRKLSQGRNQYILDLTRREVREYIIDILAERLEEGKISYVKWDMNRNMTELPTSSHGHKYILGLYEILEELTTRFPEILFESCASGGGRFDLGMMYYMPQAWTSDNTDAISRLSIQDGTSYGYPLLSMGAHVSAIPNHQTTRKTSLDTRNHVAYFGNFGYELDLLKLDRDEETSVKNYIKEYKENRGLIQFGDFYRIPSNSDNIVSWMAVDKKKSEALVGYYQILAMPNGNYNERIKLRGLEEDKLYIVDDRYKAYGDELMNLGIVLEQKERYFSEDSKSEDFSSRLFKIKEVLLK